MFISSRCSSARNVDLFVAGSERDNHHRRLCSEFPELENVCWDGKKLWMPGYYAGTTGGAGIDTVRRYIEQQDTPA